MSSSSKESDPTPRTELDSRGCLVLADIINSFHTPISEEHAWALCYQSAKCGQDLLGNPALRDCCFLVGDPKELLIQKDGTVHRDSFLDPRDNGKDPPRIKCSDEAKIIANLVLTIFLALDYGFSGDDERSISADLIALLDSMANAGCNNAERSETDDEGIERDSGDSDDDRGTSTRTFDFNSILQVCARHLSHGGTIPAADSHYKAVCRAYVAEALEFSTFIQKVSKGKTSLGNGNFLSRGTKRDPELEKLEFTDWARLWVQVIRDLRQGVKLKKVEFCRGPPIEFELTPYEILMDDIRSRRYKLNKVMVDGSLPKRIKKDAHAIILEFIRSRPPLRRAEDRILGPAPKMNQTPIERLLLSIRQEHKLAPIDLKPPQKESPRTRPLPNSTHRRIRSHEAKAREINSAHVNNAKSPGSQVIRNMTSTSHHQSPTSKTSSNLPNQAQPQRRLINFDLNFLSDPDSKDEDDDFDFSDPEDSPPEPISGFYGHICPEGSQSTPCTPSKKPAEHHHPKLGSGEVDKRRRHSVGNPTVRGEHAATLITFPFEYTTTEDVFKTLQCPRASPLLARRTAKLPRSVSKSSLQEEFFQSNHWQTAIECLSLNLEEVVHIRHVLTKAELESLPLDCSLKEDVEKGKICFLCLKTRFSFIFGPRGNSCRLCKRTVCNKCCSKMRIPAEQFANVPVSSLSPNMSPRDEERELPGSTKSLTPSTTSANPLPNANNCVTKKNTGPESAPDSPNISRKSGGTDSDSGKRSLSPTLLEDEESRDTFGTEQGILLGHGPRSLPSVQSISMGIMAMKRRSFGKKSQESTERNGGPVIVCHDCKAMVLQIIRSSRAKKAAALMKHNLTLEIPVAH